MPFSWELPPALGCMDPMAVFILWKTMTQDRPGERWEWALKFPFLGTQNLGDPISGCLAGIRWELWKWGWHFGVTEWTTCQWIKESSLRRKRGQKQTQTEDSSGHWTELPRSRRGEKRGEVPAWFSGSFLKPVQCFRLLDFMSYPCIFPISSLFIIILKILSWVGLSSLQPRIWRNFFKKLQQFFVREVELWEWFLPLPPPYSLLWLLLFF